MTELSTWHSYYIIWILKASVLNPVRIQCQAQIQPELQDNNSKDLVYRSQGSILD